MASDHSGPSTHISLIQRASQTNNQLAWSEFVQRYGPTIIGWCRKWCKQDADTHDISQEILLRVWTKLPEFQYQPDGSFRAWLRTISKNIFLDSLRRKRAEVIEDEVVRLELERHSIEFAKSIEDVFDLELLNMACAQVKPDIEPARWEMFELTISQGYETKDVATRFGKSEATVRMNNLRIRSKVTKRLREIERSLDHPRN